MTRDWMLADSTLATPAVVGQPIQPGPTGSGFEAEYKLFRDGFRDTDNEIAGDGTDLGFGLRNPDKDADHTTNGPATDVPEPQARDDRPLRGRQRHAPCLPGRAQLRERIPTAALTPPFSGFRYSACAETEARSSGASCPSTSSTSCGSA